MGRKRYRKRDILKQGTVVLLLLLVVGTVLFLIKNWEKTQGIFPSLNEEETIIEYEGKKYEPNKDVEAFLVLGLDKFEGVTDTTSYNNDKQADFLMLLVLMSSLTLACTLS